MSLFLSLVTLSKSPCMSSPCRNGGTCQPIYDREDYRCICPFANLIGKNCENCKYYKRLTASLLRRFLGSSQVLQHSHALSIFTVEKRLRDKPSVFCAGDYPYDAKFIYFQNVVSPWPPYFDYGIPIALNLLWYHLKIFWYVDLVAFEFVLVVYSHKGKICDDHQDMVIILFI